VDPTSIPTEVTVPDGIVGLFDKSLYVPVVATVASVGLPVMFAHVALLSTYVVVAKPAMLGIVGLLDKSL